MTCLQGRRLSIQCILWIPSESHSQLLLTSKFFSRKSDLWQNISDAISLIFWQKSSLLCYKRAGIQNWTWILLLIITLVHIQLTVSIALHHRSWMHAGMQLKYSFCDLNTLLWKSDAGSVCLTSNMQIHFRSPAYEATPVGEGNTPSASRYRWLRNEVWQCPERMVSRAPRPAVSLDGPATSCVWTTTSVYSSSWLIPVCHFGCRHYRGNLGEMMRAYAIIYACWQNFPSHLLGVYLGHEWYGVRACVQIHIILETWQPIVITHRIHICDDIRKYCTVYVGPRTLKLSIY